MTVTVVTVGRCGGAWPERVEAVERMTRGRGGGRRLADAAAGLSGPVRGLLHGCALGKKDVEAAVGMFAVGFGHAVLYKEREGKRQKAGEGFSRATKIRGGRSMPIPQLI